MINCSVCVKKCIVLLIIGKIGICAIASGDRGEFRHELLHGRSILARFRIGDCARDLTTLLAPYLGLQLRKDFSRICRMIHWLVSVRLMRGNYLLRGGEKIVERRLYTFVRGRAQER